MPQGCQRAPKIEALGDTGFEGMRVPAPGYEEVRMGLWHVCRRFNRKGKTIYP